MGVRYCLRCRYGRCAAIFEFFFLFFLLNWLENEIFLVPTNFFTWFFIPKMAVKMNLRKITKNHAADPEIVFLAKSISKSNGCQIAMPTAWKLKIQNLKIRTRWTAPVLRESKMYRELQTLRTVRSVSTPGWTLQKYELFTNFLR